MNNIIEIWPMNIKFFFIRVVLFIYTILNEAISIIKADKKLKGNRYSNICEKQKIKILGIMMQLLDILVLNFARYKPNQTSGRCPIIFPKTVKFEFKVAKYKKQISIYIFSKKYRVVFLLRLSKKLKINGKIIYNCIVNAKYQQGPLNILYKYSLLKLDTVVVSKSIFQMNVIGDNNIFG